MRAAISAASGANFEALTTDLAKLASAIGAAGGTRVVYVAHTGAAANANVRLSANGSDLRIIPTLGLPAGSIMVIDPGALVSGFGATPRVEASNKALVHMVDSALQPIVDTGGVVASPSSVVSMWQHRLVAIRALLDVSNVMRQPLTAVINSVTWA